MSYDELAFINLQLAGMLKSGIPLESALRRLSSTMRRGRLQNELQALEADLSKGTPLRTALQQRQLPELYRRMVLVGVEANDLPGVLTLAADHYQRSTAIATRLKGVMVYPSIVVLASLALSFFLALFFRRFSTDIPQMLNDVQPDQIITPGLTAMIWTPVMVLGILSVLVLLVVALPSLRRYLRWHLPGFKEAALAQLASAMRLILKSGSTLADGLALLRQLEIKTPAGQDLARWEQRLAAGHPRFPEIAAGSTVIPPLFSWLVSSGNEDLPAGFERAAEIYQARANYRVEMLLYAALPVSILFLGIMLVGQAYPVIRLFVQFGSMIDQLGQ
jgi:type II secretory pathway component PulF